ncbi:MAG TPA: hypothetical protein VMZ51_01685, partial [Acidimicrobiales bacterium]|nr:hypothetical protein [Acidimicrobiales bacterium]
MLVTVDCVRTKHFVLAYAGGASKVTAPTVVGPYVFAAKARPGDSVSFAPLASSPVVTVVAGAARSLVLSGLTDPSTAGDPRSITVTAKDAFANTAISYAGTVNFASTDAAGDLPASYTFVAADAGTHTLANAVVFKTAGTQSLSGADSTDATIAGSQSVTVVPGAAHHLAFSVQPSTTPSGATIAPSPKVRVEDAYNNLAASTASVDLALTGGTAGATLSGPTPVAAVGGVASFNDLAVDRVGTGYGLAATSGALTATSSSAFDVASSGQAMSGWGYNFFGQLGDGTTTAHSIPVQVGTATNWATVAAGGYHTAAIRTDGTLCAWGNNEYGQLGDGSTTARSSIPVQVGTATNWATVAAGGKHTAAIRTDGTLWAWGNNDSGQVGDGTLTAHSIPVQVGTATNWATVAAGGNHTAAIRADGTLWAWGYNGYGQAGSGSFFPARLGTATDWATVAAGHSHTAAVKTDGTLWAWGYNGYGQLGDGTTTTRFVPVQVGTATDWATVVAGDSHTAAVRTDGTLWA